MAFLKNKKYEHINDDAANVGHQSSENGNFYSDTVVSILQLQLVARAIGCYSSFP